jgi:membrane protein YqaA with SNARE-associated domain
MIDDVEAWVSSVLAWLALPQHGLWAIFLVSLISATLLPMASVPAVFAVVQANPDLFWPAMLVATAGNSAGGAISYWMGYGAEAAYEQITQHRPRDARAIAWLRRYGPPACLLSWLPFVGDPLCAIAGWLRLPFWPCVAYMAIGKFLRYLFYIVALQWAVPEGWLH